MATIVEKIYDAAHAHPKDRAVELIEAMLEAWSDAALSNEKARMMQLSDSLAYMMAEYIEGARKQPPEWKVSAEVLSTMFEKRLARFISADKISMILSEELRKKLAKIT